MKTLRFIVSLLLASLSEAAFAQQEQLSVPVEYHGQQIQLMAMFNKPPGPGHFPVVIALHSCSGYSANMFGGSLPRWVAFLQQLGYATLKIDSFTARGVSEVCRENPMTTPDRGVTLADRAADVLAGAILLTGRPDVRPDRIAAIGFSNGGGTAVYVARDYMELRPLRAQLAARGGKLVASIGLYPICLSAEGSPVIVPLLALSGASDDWTPAAACVAIANMPVNRLMALQVYPGAYHGFDVPGLAMYKLGHRLQYDAAATADAYPRVQQFLARHLQ